MIYYHKPVLLYTNIVLAKRDLNMHTVSEFGFYALPIRLKS
jgi:hypothetical protein